jgi:hypothetical protein
MHHLIAFLTNTRRAAGAGDSTEMPAEAKERHERIAERRRGIDIIFSTPHRSTATNPTVVTSFSE